jgi:circadian clock protein KaiC
MHAFSITAGGLEIYPRLRTPSETPDYSSPVDRVTSGVEGLDSMIGGGFWRGSTTLLAGPTGGGKTVMALHFLAAGAAGGEAGVYLGFQENPVQLRRTLRNFGFDDEALLREGKFEHLYRSPVEMQIDNVVLDLFRRVREKKVRRVVIDALGDLRHRSYDKQRLIEYLYSLTQWFAVEGVTCIIAVEVQNSADGERITSDEVSNMSDNIISIRFDNRKQMGREIRVLKARNSEHDHIGRTLLISAGGVRVERNES